MIRSFLLLSIFNFCLSTGKVVQIESGKISGDESRNFIAYRGIPYAKSPVGELRFAAPKRYEGNWSGVKEFKKFGAICSQYNHLTYDYEGDEDCLFLNVFVPKSVANSEKKVPVIFYIHGGAFMFGSGEFYGPENFMATQKMILVTMNYRLGVLGFLSTEDKAIPGNFGLKDQVEALRWVQRNIEAFNGDPKRVTLSGFSAGGASVHLHYMSPKTDGLFNNGISHSGNALDPWVFMENARKKAETLGSSTSCPFADHKKLLECLRSKPAKDLVVFARNYQPFLFNPFSPFGAVVEPKTESAFLTVHPKTLLEKGKFKRLPWMMTLTNNEGLYPAAEFYGEEQHLQTINEKWVELAPFILDFNGTTSNENRKAQMSRKIRKFYLGNAQITKENFESFEKICSDRLFKYGGVKSIQLQSKFSPSYCYHFKFKSLKGVSDIFAKTDEDIGVSHGEDVWLVYPDSDRDHNKLPYSKDELSVSDSLITMYFNFASENIAKYGELSILKSNPKDTICMEIYGADSYNLIEMPEDFGNVLFWDVVEQILNAPERTFYDEL